MLQAIYNAIDPVAFAIGPLQVRWYGLAYLAGFVICSLVIYKVAQRWRVKFTTDDLLVIVICIMIGTILGGRLGYVLFYGNGYYLTNPAKIFAFQDGGMSFHGGVIGIVIGGIVASKITKVKFVTMADLVVVAAPIGLFFGRCANFINGELWGAVTDLPWGVVFENAGSLPRHPSQLYEALLEGVVLFIILYSMSRKKPPLPQGTYIGTFLILYGVFRILIEFVRQPDAQIGYLFGNWLTMGMLLSVPLILAGVGFLIYAHKRKLPQASESQQLTQAACD